MTLPELLLWKLLRKCPDDMRFRRQHPVDNYVLDFYCAAAKVGVEIDGMAHDMGDRPERDIARDRIIESYGIEVIRIAASEVLKSPECVAESIVTYCKNK